MHTFTHIYACTFTYLHMRNTYICTTRACTRRTMCILMLIECDLCMYVYLLVHRYDSGHTARSCAVGRVVECDPVICALGAKEVCARLNCADREGSACGLDHEQAADHITCHVLFNKRSPTCTCSCMRTPRECEHTATLAACTIN